MCSKKEGYPLLVSKLDEYIEFLFNCNQAPVSNAYAHGWRCPQADINKGVTLREEIRTIRQGIV